MMRMILKAAPAPKFKMAVAPAGGRMCALGAEYLANLAQLAPPPPPPIRGGALPIGIPPPPSMKKFVSLTNQDDFNGAGMLAYIRSGRDEGEGITYVYMNYGKPLLVKKWDLMKRNPNWKRGMDESTKTMTGLTQLRTSHHHARLLTNKFLKIRELSRKLLQFSHMDSDALLV